MLCVEPPQVSTDECRTKLCNFVDIIKYIKNNIILLNYMYRRKKISENTTLQVRNSYKSKFKNSNPKNNFKNNKIHI